MTTIVVPFRGPDGKRRLAPLPPELRAELALAMLGDVVAACVAVAPTVVVTSDPAVAALGLEVVADPGGGQGAAVAAALSGLAGEAAVVNADLPCAQPDDLRALLAALPPGGVALVPARDGTTNALALSRAGLFRPEYGPGSAARFAALGPSRLVDVPNLVDDVDTLGDLDRLEARLGSRTRAVLATLRVTA
jgi:2-phospho-L-lactate guanylyltransferase